MDDDIAELQRQLSRARTEGERVRLRRLIDGEPEPAPSAGGPTPPNDQVLDDLIRAIAPPRGALASDLVEVQVRALMQLIAYARYGDTLRWHRMNHVPELTPLEKLTLHFNVKIAAMSARGEIPRLTGKDWWTLEPGRQAFAERLATSVDRAFVVADRITWRGG